MVSPFALCARLSGRIFYFSVGPQHREVITKFGSVLQPREAAFDRKTLRQANAITNYRDVKGGGCFATSAAGHLQIGSLVPAHALSRAKQEVTTARRLLDAGVPPNSSRLPSSAPAAAAAAYRGPRMHHPPPARAPEAPMRAAFVPTSRPAPYAWTPNNPESVTYGFHRRW